MVDMSIDFQPKHCDRLSTTTNMGSQTSELEQERVSLEQLQEHVPSGNASSLSVP